MKKVHFALKQFMDLPGRGEVDLYEEIKAGRKTSEFREYKPYWVDRLYKKKEIDGVTHMTPKVDRAWFTVGYPKGLFPRLEADIKSIRIILDEDEFAQTFEIMFENVIEVTGGK